VAVFLKGQIPFLSPSQQQQNNESYFKSSQWRKPFLQCFDVIGWSIKGTCCSYAETFSLDEQAYPAVTHKQLNKNQSSKQH